MTNLAHAIQAIPFSVEIQNVLESAGKKTVQLSNNNSYLIFWNT